jgi:hypothetical protein
VRYVFQESNMPLVLLNVLKVIWPYLLGALLLGGVYVWADHHFSAKQKAEDAVVIAKQAGVIQNDEQALNTVNAQLQVNKNVLDAAQKEAAKAVADAVVEHAKIAKLQVAAQAQYNKIKTDPKYSALQSKQCEVPDVNY